MKILFIVIFALATHVHCEDAEERPDQYSFEKDNEVGETNTKREYLPVQASTNEYSSSYKGYDNGLDTNQVTSNGQGQFVAIPKGQSYQYIKNSPISNQFPQSFSYGQNTATSVPYKVTYQSYPVPISTYHSDPVKPTVADQFTQYANIPQPSYGASYQVAKPFVSSPQIYGQQETTGLEGSRYISNNYGPNQYKFARQYAQQPTAWAGVNNGFTNGYVSNANSFETGKEYSPVGPGYGPASAVAKETPDFSGYGSNSYSAGHIQAPNTFGSSGFRSTNILSAAAVNVGTGYKFNNFVQHPQYFNQEYKPNLVSGYSSGFGTRINHGGLIGKAPETALYSQQQYMYVAPKEYASPQFGNYASPAYNQPQFGSSFQYGPRTTTGYNAGYPTATRFQSSLRDIVKMISEEQRKSNGKAIYLIGKPQVPMHMLTNLAGYQTRPNQQAYTQNVNAFGGYKY